MCFWSLDREARGGCFCRLLAALLTCHRFTHGCSGRRGPIRHFGIADHFWGRRLAWRFADARPRATNNKLGRRVRGGRSTGGRVAGASAERITSPARELKSSPRRSVRGPYVLVGES